MSRSKRLTSRVGMDVALEALDLPSWNEFFLVCELE